MDNVFITSKIRIEKVTVSMAETIFGAINENREFLQKWLPFVEFTNDVSDTELFLKSVSHNADKTKNYVFAIWYKHEFAGLIGFKDTDWVNHKTEFGYWLVEKMQGKGIITNTLKKLIEHAFSDLKLNRIQIKVAIGNSKSAAIAKNLGFTLEGTERDGEFHHNKYLDLQVFSLLKSEWLAT